MNRSLQEWPQVLLRSFSRVVVLSILASLPMSGALSVWAPMPIASNQYAHGCQCVALCIDVQSESCYRRPRSSFTSQYPRRQISNPYWSSCLRASAERRLLLLKVGKEVIRHQLQKVALPGAPYRQLSGDRALTRRAGKPHGAPHAVLPSYGYAETLA